MKGFGEESKSVLIYNSGRTEGKIEGEERTVKTTGVYLVHHLYLPSPPPLY